MISRLIWATTCDFQQCGILTSVDSDEHVQPPLKLRNSKWCSVSSLTLREYSSDFQRLWSDCAYAQAELRLCWSHIPHCWKSHVVAHLYDHFKDDLRSLPHTEGTLTQHVLKAFIQIIISKSAHLSQQHIPDPTEYGWHATNNRLIPTIILTSAKPTVVTINPSSVSARKSKCLRSCSCSWRANPDKCWHTAKLLAIREDSDEYYILYEAFILQSKCHHSNMAMLLRHHPSLSPTFA